MSTKLPNVSILTAGEAKGHDLLIDQTSLEQALAVAKTMGRIKVTNGHGARQVMDILGYVENFSIKGNRLMGDLTLLDSDKAKYVQDLAELMPDQFGLSLTFSGIPETTEQGRMARVTEIYDVSVVATPAANPAGMFSAFSRLPVDSVQHAMDKTVEPIVAVKAELAAEPVAEAKPEPTLKDVIAMLTTLLGYHEKMNAHYDEEKEEMSAAVEAPAEAPVESAPAPEAAPAVDAALEEAKAKIIDLETKLTAKSVDLEASKGTQPIEMTEAKPLSRNELLAKFNEEKDPRRAAEIFNQIKLAR